MADQTRDGKKISGRRLYWIVGLLTVIAGFSLYCESTVEPNFVPGLKVIDSTGAHKLYPKRPLAIGATLPIRVTGEGSDEVSQITGIEFTIENRFAAHIHQPNKFTLVGIGSGGTLIEVHYRTPSGTERTIDFRMQAREATELQLSQPCRAFGYGTNEDPKTLYLPGATIPVTYTMYDDDGERLQGYELYPFEVDGQMEFDEQRKQAGCWWFQGPASPGSTTIYSTVDDREFSFEFVEEDQIDGVAIIHTYFRGAGDEERRYFDIVPTIDGDIICLAEVDRHIENLTPGECTLEMGGRESTAQPYATASVSGWDEDQPCVIEASFLYPNGETRARGTFEIGAEIRVVDDEELVGQ